MDFRALKELCQRLDELAAILEIMEGEPVNVDLHREASHALNQTLSEIERLRSDVDLHCETSHALRDALAEINRLQADADSHHKTSEALREALGEIERLRSDVDLHRETSNALRDALAETGRLQPEAADLQHTKFDKGLSNLAPALTAWATDWFTRLLERKQVLTGEKVKGRKNHAD
jgi:chromosome segregation ATPase